MNTRSMNLTPSSNVSHRTRGSACHHAYHRACHFARNGWLDARRTTSAALLCAAALLAAGSAHAQRDGSSPEALQLAPAATAPASAQAANSPASARTANSAPQAQAAIAAPSDANGLRIAPGSKAAQQVPSGNPATTATPPAPTGPDAEEIVRALTGAEPLQPPRDITRTGYWQANGYWLIPTIGALLIAAAAIGYGLYRRRKRPVVLSPQLLALRDIDLAHAHGDDKLFAIAVSDAVRGYLEARFRLRAPEQTTEEFLQEARHSTHLPPAAVDSLAHLLELCDLAKFARQGLSEPQRTELAETARQLVLFIGTPQEAATADAPAADTSQKSTSTQKR